MDTEKQVVKTSDGSKNVTSDVLDGSPVAAYGTGDSASSSGSPAADESPAAILSGDDNHDASPQEGKGKDIDTSATEPVIFLVDVAVSHPEGSLLSHVNLTVRRGEFVYLIGKSGAGKTSLMRCLYADKEIDEGDARVCGFDIVHLRRRNVPLLRRRIGIVFQNFRLLQDRTVFENLRFVLQATGWKKREEIEERVEEVLRSVGLADKADVRTYRLSEGEQQRVGIARALVNRPDLILADEPTGNLDPLTSAEIMRLLVDINRKDGVTMLISTHDFMMIDKFPARVVACENGTLCDPER